MHHTLGLTLYFAFNSIVRFFPYNLIFHDHHLQKLYFTVGYSVIHTQNFLETFSIILNRFWDKASKNFRLLIYIYDLQYMYVSTCMLAYVAMCGGRGWHCDVFLNCLSSSSLLLLLIIIKTESLTELGSHHFTARLASQPDPRMSTHQWWGFRHEATRAVWGGLLRI